MEPPTTRRFCGRVLYTLLAATSAGGCGHAASDVEATGDSGPVTTRTSAESGSTGSSDGTPTTAGESSDSGMESDTSSSTTGPGTALCQPACGAGAYCDSVSLRCFCPPDTSGDPSIACTAHGDVCGAAETRVGHSVCRHRVADPETWTTISLGGQLHRQDVRRVGKYLVPAHAGARLPTVFADANQYRLHLCLMGEGFEPWFPALEGGVNRPAYAELLFWRATREFYGGSIYEFVSEDGAPPTWGFTIETRHDDPAELLTQAETYFVYRHLADRFAHTPIGYTPVGDLRKAQVANWHDTDFPIHWGGRDEVSYEPYTLGLTYGRVRSLSASDVDQGLVSFG